MIYLAVLNPFLIKVIFLSLILAFIPTLIALIDIQKSKFNRNDKIFWVLVVLLFNLIGTMIYFTIGRKQKINT